MQQTDEGGDHEEEQNSHGPMHSGNPGVSAGQQVEKNGAQQGHQGSHGKIDAAGNDHEPHAQTEDAIHADLSGQILQVSQGEETRLQQPLEEMIRFTVAAEDDGPKGDKQ